MRVVYGAGAVAAMSIMAVGLVQPNWNSTADQGADSYVPTDDPGAIAALPDGKAEDGQPDPAQGNADAAGSGKVQHVIRYIFLKPGQTAPPGATVVWATAAPPRVVHNRPSNPDPTAVPRPHNGGGVSATPRPTPRPTHAAAATPRPTPKPTTRQSGQH